MRKVLAVLTLAVGISMAQETSADVPVTINHTGGCVFEGLPSVVNFGNLPQTAYMGTSTYSLPAVSFGVRCTAGLNYTVRVQSGLYSASGYDFVWLNGSGSVRLGLFRDSNYTQRITNSNPQIASGTGTGSVQDVTIYPRLEGCISPPCPTGTFSGTITLRITY